MHIEKRINNNVVLAKENGVQMILMGKGLGFQTHPGDNVLMEKVEKRFYGEDLMTGEQMAALMTNATAAEIEMTENLVRHGQERLQKPLNPNLFFTLLDHLLFSVKQRQDTVEFSNPLEWEIKKFYPAEYEVGLQAVVLASQIWHRVIPESEAAFIALHFVNGQLESTVSRDAVELTELTYNILRLVRFQLATSFEEDSLYYNRFITHIRYYLMRQKAQDSAAQPDTAELIQLVFQRFPKEKRCVDTIDDYLTQEKGWVATELEKMYLILHIRNLIEKKEQLA